MSKQLGIGVRVYCGWAPDDQVTAGFGFARCATGTITDGPFPPGLIDGGNGNYFLSNECYWNVAIDGVGLTGATESCLTPIDDNEEQEQATELKVAGADPDELFSGEKIKDLLEVTHGT